MGMGKDAQNVQAAADFFEKANKVLGYNEAKIFYQIVLLSFPVSILFFSNCEIYLN